MNALRPLAFAAALAAFATAQDPAMADETAPLTGMQTPAEMPPVMDRQIFAHAIFNQLEGRWNGSNAEFRWEGQGWAGTDYDKLWIKSEGTVSNGAVADGQQQFLYSRAVTTYFDLQGGLRSDIDVLIVNLNEPPSLLRNDLGGMNHWLKVKLIGVKSNRSAIGARVTARYGSRVQAQEVLSQSSFYSANDLRLHFGLGTA